MFISHYEAQKCQLNITILWKEKQVSSSKHDVCKQLYTLPSFDCRDVHLSGSVHINFTSLNILTFYVRRKRIIKQTHN